MLVLLVGPPVSGKDAVTHRLVDLAKGYCHFRPLKVSVRPTGHTDRYVPSSNAEFERLHRQGAMLYEAKRYGNRYGFDRERLEALERGNRAVIVHVAEVAAVDALRAAFPGSIAILLWCSRDIAEARLTERSPSLIQSRLAAWDDISKELSEVPFWWDAAIRTDQLSEQATTAVVANIIESASSRSKTLNRDAPVPGPPLKGSS